MRRSKPKKAKMAYNKHLPPPNQDDHYFLVELIKVVDKYSNDYDNFVIMGDFNIEIDNDNIENSLQAYVLHSLIREPTCFKSSPPKCIDLILTNRKHNFIHCTPIETGLSDFHKLTSTILKTEFIKGEPQIVTYRNFKNVNAIHFNNDIRDEMQQINNPSYSSFSDIFARVLDSHAPLKKKAVITLFHSRPIFFQMLRPMRRKPCLCHAKFISLSFELKFGIFFVAVMKPIKKAWTNYEFCTHYFG